MLVDAGVLIAALDRDEDEHPACAELLRHATEPLIVPMLTVTEVAYLIPARMGIEVEVRLLGDLAAGNFVAEPVHPSDWERIAELVWQYRDFPLGTVDASVIAVAERLDITRVATLDHRHFRAVRPRHAHAFELLP